MKQDKPYNQRDHLHCWQQEEPACGLGEHKKCCLCELPKQENKNIEEECDCALCKNEDLDWVQDLADFVPSLFWRDAEHCTCFDMPEDSEYDYFDNWLVDFIKEQRKQSKNQERQRWLNQDRNQHDQEIRKNERQRIVEELEEEKQKYSSSSHSSDHYLDGMRAGLNEAINKIKNK